MPTRETAPLGAPCWVDLMTSDAARSRAFYAELFGWTADEPVAEFGGYFNFAKDGIRVGGGMPRDPAADAGLPDVWSVYLATDDAAKTAEMALANGGQVHVEPMAVADLGTMLLLGDAGGAAIGAWQPDQFPGFGIVAETGAPSWFELHTRDYAAAVDFYRSVFRWDTEVISDTPEFRYTVFKQGDTMFAGIADAGAYLPDGVPSHWSVYFGVDDTDAALAKVVELGGAIVTPAEDTPYGRLATATDPTGAQFKLVAPNEAMPGNAQ